MHGYGEVWVFIDNEWWRRVYVTIPEFIEAQAKRQMKMIGGKVYLNVAYYWNAPRRWEIKDE